MRSFCMIILHIFLDYILQMTLSEDEHPVQTFLFNAPDKPFDETVQVGRHRQGFNGFDSRAFKNLSERFCE